MIDYKQFEFWFVAGSQHLYGAKALEKVAANAREISGTLDAAASIPATILPASQRRFQMRRFNHLVPHVFAV
jgi:L-arabinose isomerase